MFTIRLVQWLGGSSKPKKERKKKQTNKQHKERKKHTQINKQTTKQTKLRRQANRFRIEPKPMSKWSLFSEIPSQRNHKFKNGMVHSGAQHPPGCTQYIRHDIYLHTYSPAARHMRSPRKIKDVVASSLSVRCLLTVGGNDVRARNRPPCPWDTHYQFWIKRLPDRGTRLLSEVCWHEETRDHHNDSPILG